jgi:hypothetical protein
MRYRHYYGKRSALALARVFVSAFRILRAVGYTSQSERFLQKSCDVLCRAGLPATREAALGALAADIEAETAADAQDADAVDAAHALVALSSGCDATRVATLHLRTIRLRLRQKLRQYLHLRQNPQRPRLSPLATPHA